MPQNKLIIDRKRVDVLMERVEIRTYMELANTADVHYNTVTNALNGGPFSSTTARKLADALKCSPIDLMTAQGYPDPNSVALAVH